MAKAPAKAATKAAPKSGVAKKPNALQIPLKPSPELAAVVGVGPLPRGQVVSKMWDYIKKHKLQNPQNKREILADDHYRLFLARKRWICFRWPKRSINT